MENWTSKKDSMVDSQTHQRAQYNSYVRNEISYARPMCVCVCCGVCVHRRTHKERCVSSTLSLSHAGKKTHSEVVEDEVIAAAVLKPYAWVCVCVCGGGKLNGGTRRKLSS